MLSDVIAPPNICQSVSSEYLQHLTCQTCHKKTADSPCFSFSLRGSVLYTLNPFSIPHAKHPGRGKIYILREILGFPAALQFHLQEDRPRDGVNIHMKVSILKPQACMSTCAYESKL